MTNYIVKYHLPNEKEIKQLEVTGYNVFHAEKLAKEKLGRISITSVSSAGRLKG